VWGASTRADPGVAPVVEGRMVADAGWGRRWPQNARPVMGGSVRAARVDADGRRESGGRRTRKGRDRTQTIFKGFFRYIFWKGSVKQFFSAQRRPLRVQHFR
jgi:hypothetical protein